MNSGRVGELVKYLQGVAGEKIDVRAGVVLLSYVLHLHKKLGYKGKFRLRRYGKD